MARKKAQAFRTITEVSDWLDTPSHVLRFWESKFPQIKPVKRAGGRRYYRPEDLKLIGGIKHLLHDKGTTIASVKEMIKTDGEESVEAYSAEPVFPEKGRRKKRKTAAAAATTASTETQETQKEEILTLDAEIEAAPQTEPLVLEPAAIQSEPLQLEPAPLSPLVLEVSEDTEERETSARDVISNAVSRTLNEQTEATTNDEASSELNLSLGQLKSRTQIASDRVLDIEDMYFQLQRIRNRMKRRLEALG